MKFRIEEDKKYSIYTNGTIDKRVYTGETPPDGFYKGSHNPRTPWNKGLTAKDDERVLKNTQHTQATRAQREYTSWNKGLTMDDPRVFKNITNAQNTIKTKYGVDNISQYLTKQTDFQVWNKGLTKDTNDSVKKISDSNKGKDPWNRGLTLDTDSRITSHVVSDTMKQHLSDVHKDPNFKQARYDKMRSNNTLCVHDSRAQQEFYNYLLTQFDSTEIIKEYFDRNRYPFKCDFYIIPEDLFIELHINWTHGGRPYDPNDIECQEKLKIWQEKAKTSKFYQNAIYTWTDLDVRKAKIAKQNNLNFKAIYKL